MRTVFNLPPSNELQIQVEGDTAALPYHGHWQGLVLDDDTVGYWFSEDMVSSFFLFELPPEFAVLFVLERPLPGRLLGSENEAEYIGLTIVPPGWLSANGVIQYLHRRLVMLANALPR